VVVEARRVGRGGGDAGDPVDLGPIWWNRFGRNLRIKPNLVSFKFVCNYDLKWF
jgi:hypothetical protein